MPHEYELVGSIAGRGIFPQPPNSSYYDSSPGYYYTTSNVLKLFISEIDKGKFKLKYLESDTNFEGDLIDKKHEDIDYNVLLAILSEFTNVKYGYGNSFKFTDLNRDTYFLCHKEEMPILVLEYIMRKSNQAWMEDWEG